MQTKQLMWAIVIAVIALAASFSACKKDNPVSPPVTVNPDSLVYSPKATMYGKSYSQWATEWWKWNLQFDCAHVPLRDTTGSLENQQQGGSVYFLGGRRGHTLAVTVPAGASIFFPLISFETEYPCVDNGDPNPGETVDQFITRLTQTSTTAIDQLALTIDGKSVGNLASYKILSPVFTFAANPDLANCFDGCITVAPQPFVAGGCFFMMKPLSPGQHTIHRVGGASSLFPFVYDITYNITQL